MYENFDVDLSMFSSNVTVYAAITFQVHEVYIQVLYLFMSALAWLGIQWRFFKFVRTVRVFNSCATISTIIVNHGVIRGTNARIEVLFDVVESLKLVALNDGRTTPVHPGVNDSVPDVTFPSPVSQSRVLWHLEPDLWGSDHPPIRLTPTRSSPSIVHFHRVHMRCLSPKTA